jgi:putative ABC transport system permease protein
LPRGPGRALRQLAAAPGFTITALTTLALAIGFTTMVFSAVHAILLHPLPLADQDRLVVVWQHDPRRDASLIELSYREYEAWRDHARAFEDAAAMTASNFRVNLTGLREPVQVEASAVSGNFFGVLGATVRLGRGLTPADDAAGAVTAVVIGHALWQQHFGSDPGIIGRRLVADGGDAVIVGVAHADMPLPRHTDLWVPLAPLGRDAPDLGVLKIVARLRPGLGLDAARSRLDEAAPLVDASVPQRPAGLRATLVPVAHQLYGETRGALLLLSIAVGAVLLIACANVANLLLARGLDRSREMAIRLAIGASRRRLVTQLLVESGVLAGVGALGGVLAAAWGLGALGAILPPDVPGADRIRLNVPVLAFAIGVTGFTTMLFGLLPAWRTSAVDPGDAVRTAGHRSSSGPDARRTRAVLVVAEIALALVLVVSASLGVAGLRRVTALDAGFDPTGVVTARINLPATYGTREARTAFYADVIGRVSAVPGVSRAGVVLLRPLADPIGWDWPFTIEGQTADDHARNPALNFEAVSPSYFATLRIPVLQGRGFTDADGPSAPPVAIVSARLADRYFRGTSPLGRRIKAGPPDGPAVWKTIVGVAGDVRYRGWLDLRYDIYVPLPQWNFGRMDLVARAAGEGGQVAAGLRAAVRVVDASVPLASITTMTREVRAATAGPRFVAWLLSLFAAAGLVLATVGVAGLVSRTVHRRAREMGVRIALGAPPAALARGIVRRAMMQAALGIGAGLVLATAAARLMRSLLSSIPALDLAVVAGSSAALALVALASALVPAARILRIDPVRTLREE